MNISKLNHKNRILLIQEFVDELIINSAKDYRIKNLIETEKLKRKYLEKGKTLVDFGKNVVFNDEENIEQQNSVKKLEALSSISNADNVKIEIPNIKPKVSLSQLSKQNYLNKQKKEEIIKSVTSIKAAKISNKEEKGVLGLLTKIDILIKDPGVQLIECPGPGRYILVKARNKINSTNINLSQQEIDNIINYFSEQSKIPIVGGIIRAAVGDLIISGVSSENVGSRFIITKKSPYSLIEKT